jgi:RimJ/RimL family protein N-acetyltransferase
MTALFQTDRLVIRDWQPQQDALQAFEIYGDPEVTRFIGNSQTEESVEAVRDRLQKTVDYYHSLGNGTGSWAIVEKETAQIVGAILLKQLPDQDSIPTQDYEIGWHLRRLSWGKGYATEAGRGIVDYGFRVLQLPVLYAVVKPENARSIRVTQRLGMTPLGRSDNYYGGVELLLFQLEAFGEDEDDRD